MTAKKFEKARKTLKRLANELPTIGVGAIAVARVIGVELDPESVNYFIEIAQSGIGFAVWLLVRENIDGIVTITERARQPGQLDRGDDIATFDHGEGVGR